MSTEQEIIRLTLKDLAEDLAVVADASYAEAQRVTDACGASQDNTIVDATARDVIKFYNSLERDMRGELEKSKAWTSSDIARLIALKKRTAILMRETASLAGAAMIARTWQAPGTGTENALNSRFATFVGNNPNSYKRGGFTEAQEYERRFAKEYIDGNILPPQVYLTSSGMGALLTVLVNLNSEFGRKGRPHRVLVGKSTYFENPWLIEQIFPGAVTYVDESDSECILAVAKELMPSILLFDTVAYAESLVMPDWKTIIPKLSKILRYPSTFVLDNSYMGAGFQPLKSIPWGVGGMDMIVIESLNKFYEFGTDRVSGGVIWTTRDLENGIMVARNHCGTMIADASVASLPLPNRNRFDRRMSRMDRNATFLARLLDEHLRATPTIKKVEEIIHPSLPSFPGYKWTKDMDFKGCCVTISFAKGYRSAFYYSQFIARAMANAHSLGISIEQGTSFGLDTSRVSIAAFYSGEARRFVRISVGTETRQEIEKIARAFIEAID